MIDEAKQMCINVYNIVHIYKKMYNTVLFYLFIELLYTFVIYNVNFY